MAIPKPEQTDVTIGTITYTETQQSATSTLTTLAGTTWGFHSTYDPTDTMFTGSNSFNVNFMSATTTLPQNQTSLGFSVNNGAWQISYSGSVSGNASAWTDPASVGIPAPTRAVHFVDGDDIANPTLIAWFEANATRLDTPIPQWTKDFTPSKSDCIYFTCEHSFQIGLLATGPSFEIWQNGSWVANTNIGNTHNTYSSSSENGVNVLYIRGSGNSQINANGQIVFKVYYSTSALEKIYLSGDLSCLLDYQTKPTTISTGSAFYALFDASNNLVALDTYNLTIPFTTLAGNDFRAGFASCFALTNAPSLPATTLGTRSYGQMFAGCVSLKTLPDLPATTLAANCYTQMFYSCASIKLSETQTGNYTKAYRIPTEGTGTSTIAPVPNMFTYTGGTFTGTPKINTTYYLYEEPQPTAEPSLNFGGSDVSLFLGSSYVSKVYLGSTLLYERTSVGYNVTFTASGRWADAGTSYGVKIFDGQDTNGTLLVDSIPGDKNDFPQTLEISSGYCTIQVVGSTIIGFDLTTSEYTFAETGSYTWIFTAPINQSGSVDIAVSTFDD